MALPMLVDCVLLANAIAMLMLGSIAFAPSMAPDGELVRTSRGCPLARLAPFFAHAGTSSSQRRASSAPPRPSLH